MSQSEHRNRFARLYVTLVGLLVVIGACGESRSTKSDGPYADIVEEVVPRIEKQVGLEFKSPPKLERRSRDQVASFVMQQLTSDRAKAQLSGQQRLYQLLGLIPDTMDLGGLLQKLLEEQIIGYYDPTTKVLYVVDGSPENLLQLTISHELVHALQDQYVNIDSIQTTVGDADRQAAAQAVLEGQAVFEQLRLDPNTGPMMKMPGGWERIRDVMRDGQTGMPVFASAPQIVREGLLFPYIGGADFVRRFVSQRPESELLSDLPVSTKQILNDAAYFTGDKSLRDVPTSIELPVPSRGDVVYANSFGEFETRLMLLTLLKDEGQARRGASGIDGDRFELVNTGSGDGIVWVSVWDTTVDAADMLNLLFDGVRRRYGMSKQNIEPGMTTLSLDVSSTDKRSRRTVSVRLEQAGGRPVIIFEDFPASANWKPVNAADIKIAG